MNRYILIIIPLLVAVLTQIIKLSIDKIKGNLTMKDIFLSYGGMPSAHTALAVSVTTLMALTEGLYSPLFAMSFVFTLIIMRDAVTFRNILGQQGKLLNTFTKLLPSSQKRNMPKFMERVGHSFSEVVMGALWGIASTYILYTALIKLTAMA